MFIFSETEAFMSGVCQCHQDSQNQKNFTKFVVKEIQKLDNCFSHYLSKTAQTRDYTEDAHAIVP